ncbi:MAG: PKD domain-containing protein [Euryarchaeota archaeon]|nr:PKD domain-containing protein [Euryarchaeota archaeon]
MGMELSVTYEYDFPEPFIYPSGPDRLFGVTGLDLDSRGGVPALPMRSVFLAVPPGHRLIDVEVRCFLQRTIGFTDSYPTNPTEIALNGERSFSHEYEPISWEVSGRHVLEGVEVVGINLRPLCWDERTGALSFVGRYSVTLVYEESSIDFLGDVDRVRDLVDNPQAVPDLSSFTTSSVLPVGDYDHLIITSRDLSAPFQELAHWKGEREDLGSAQDNIRSTVVALEDILEDDRFWGIPSAHAGTGNDTQTIIRNFIITAHQEWGVQYVLIGGDDDIVPARMVKAPYDDNQIDELTADIYFSGLDGDWDSDGDGVYGEPGSVYVADEADLLAEVFVGRATVSTVKQAWNFVNKTIAYERGHSNQYGDDILLIGELLDSATQTYGDDYMEEVWDLVLADEGLDRSTLYARDGTFSGSAVLAAMGSGVHVINHMGHGNFESMTELDNEDVRGLQNELPFIVYTQACNVAGFDEKEDRPGDCIAEEFIQGEGGAVAFIGNSRYGWYVKGSTDGSSQKFDISFFGQVYDHDVTDLGRALSYSKEEHANLAFSAGTVRWVYLEQNLLGDPETRVHLPGSDLHDLAVQGMDVGRAILDEPCPIEVWVRNLGHSDQVGKLVLEADGEEVDNRTFSLGMGEDMTILLEWTPLEHRVSNITARVICAADQRPGNDGREVRSMVDRRIVSDESWTGNVTLPGGLLVDPLVTVNVSDCEIALQPSDLPYHISVLGALSLNGSTFQGSPFSIGSDGGRLELRNGRLLGMSSTCPSTFAGGSLYMRDMEIVGGAGWLLNGTSVDALNVTLTGQSGEWLMSDSAVYLDRLFGQGGDGLRLLGATGAVTSSSWTGGSSGISIDSCVGMVLRDLVLNGNGMDMDICGDLPSHFMHEVENVSLTYGPLMMMQGLNNATVEEVSGSLYLIGCHDMIVRNSRFGNSGSGLTLVNSSNVEMLGNAFENCTIGIRAVDSQGLAWGNDLLFNDVQVFHSRSELSFGKEYPLGGNHWSDMAGEDAMGGEHQDEPGADGIFDDAYDAGGTYDRYPRTHRCSYLYDRLEASFSQDAEQADRTGAVTFVSTSTSGIGIANWTWDMGDGTIAHGPSVAHTYPSLGTFTVNLTVTDHFGQEDGTEGAVQVINLRPVCDFSNSPTRPKPGDAVQFNDLSTDLDGEIVSWLWDFGDGSFSDSRSPQHTFVNEGDYLVSLTVNDTDGAIGTMARALAVGNDPPVAAFSWSPTSITTVVDVNFISQSSDIDGTLTSWTWDLGDGSSGSGADIRHRYSSLGTYTVTLVVTDDNGASDSVSKTITVVNSRPVAVFMAPAQVESLSAACFEDRSYDLDGIITGWSWTFGDGGASNDRSPTHVFLVPGTYSVTLTVTDDRGWAGKRSSDIIVTNRLPEVNLTTPQGDHWSLDVIDFSASASDPDGMVVNYTWEMGDGAVKEGGNVTHAYRAPGTYNVTVTCRDDSNGETSVSSLVTILNLAPRAEVLMQQGGHPLELVFIAQAQDDDGRLTRYDWSFGDGAYGEGEMVRHEYAEEGSYEVKLTVIDDVGGMVEAGCMAEVLPGNLYLSGMRLSYVRGTGWELSGEIWNEGELPVNVTLSVDAGNRMFLWEIEVSGEGFEPFHLPLTGFEGGEVNATLLTPERWETDLRDNLWTGDGDPWTPFVPWIAGGAAIVMALAAMVMYARRRG